MFESLLKSAVAIAITPVTAVADVVTMGDNCYTGRALEAAIENLMDAIED